MGNWNTQRSEIANLINGARDNVRHDPDRTNLKLQEAQARALLAIADALNRAHPQHPGIPTQY